MTTEEKNKEILKVALAAASAELDSISAADAELTKRREAVLGLVASALGKLEPLEGDEEEWEDSEELEDLRDRIDSVFHSQGYTWNGGSDGWGYGSWVPGEPIEFWVPSNC